MPGKSRAIPIRFKRELDRYVMRVMEAREYSSINLTVNQIVREHQVSNETYRLRAKIKAQKLRDAALLLIKDFGLTEKDMQDS